MIQGLHFRTTAYEAYVDDYVYPLEYLYNIRHINIFVGENNSGKSRMMRLLVNDTDALLLTDEMSSSSRSEIKIIRNRIRDAIAKISIEYPEIDINPRHDNMSVVELFIYYSLYHKRKLQELKLGNVGSHAKNDIKQLLNKLYQIIVMQSLRNNNNRFSQIPKIYIPVLRGVENYNNYFDIKKNETLDTINMNQSQRRALEQYKQNAKQIYENKIRTVYKMSQFNIFTGENLYEEIRDKLLGEESDRLFIRNFEQFVSKHFCDGEGFTIIPLINHEYLNVKIGNSEERALHDLGDGIKQLICILYKVYELRDKEAFFFIEEPEINLHPGYQRKLINIFQLEEFSKLYFFITTHSNHFVDSCFEYDNISIFKFINVNKKNNQFQVISTAPNDVEVLNLLGVNNSSVFMSNVTIWVEGISDKILISKFFQVYLKDKDGIDFKEDVDYSFVEYGGNNITHWAFENDDNIDTINASGITNRAMIIVDNDNDEKQKRKEKLKSVFRDRYYELSVREIENTIAPAVLLDYLFPDGEPQYKPRAEKKKDRYNTKSSYLWKYIDDHYELSKKYWDARKKVPTINKMKFAKDISYKINSTDDLSNEAISICDEIYDFLMTTYNNIND